MQGSLYTHICFSSGNLMRCKANVQSPDQADSPHTHLMMPSSKLLRTESLSSCGIGDGVSSANKIQNVAADRFQYRCCTAPAYPSLDHLAKQEHVSVPSCQLALCRPFCICFVIRHLSCRGEHLQASRQQRLVPDGVQLSLTKFLKAMAADWRISWPTLGSTEMRSRFTSCPLACWN